jgi:hypothetical protein
MWFERRLRIGTDRLVLKDELELPAGAVVAVVENERASRW